MCLTNPPILVHPNWENPFIVQMDASNMAIAAVLAQLNGKGQEQVVQFASRQLSEAEKKWDTREKELLAVVWSCETFRPYLTGREFWLRQTMLT